MGSGASKKIPLRDDQVFHRAINANEFQSYMGKLENKPGDNDKKQEETTTKSPPSPETSKDTEKSIENVKSAEEPDNKSGTDTVEEDSINKSTEDLVNPQSEAIIAANIKEEEVKKKVEAEEQKEDFASPPKDDTVPWIDKLKSVASKVDNMWPEPREERPQWQQLLQRAAGLLEKPRQALPEATVSAVLHGDLGQMDVRTTSNKVIVFISSTFTDTTAERNALMKDVYPYLRRLCRALGLDFGTVDMRWGVREETTEEHGTAEMCRREIQRCKRESAGPAFLSILSHKYGFSPFPPEILQSEYDDMISRLQETGESVDILNKCFTLDTNAVPPKYILIPKSKYEGGSWWDAFDEMKRLFTIACEGLHEKDQEKYKISITADEIKHGIFLNDAKEDQVIAVCRELENIKTQVHWHRHVIDMLSPTEVNWKAVAKSEALKKEKLLAEVPEGSLREFQYPDAGETELTENVKHLCDSVCESMSESILTNYEKHLHVEDDELYREVCAHRQMVLDKCSVFLGREDLVGSITNYIKLDSSGNRKLFVVYGQSGCGKTSLMSMAAKQTRELFPNAVVMVRLLGTTGDSGSARAVLSSLCMQLCRAYGKDETQIPVGYKELIPYFRECLGYATKQKPLKIFLDSLDQLSNEDFGTNLKWLSLNENMPSNVHLVVSTLPIETLDILEGYIPKDNLLEVKNLNLSDGPLILDKMLAAEERTLTPEQKKVVLDRFENCPLPLYLRLAADIAIRWRSYDKIDPEDIAPDMVGLISTIFTRLQSRYGTLLVHHALAYITAAKFGLSVAELEDILSCDDDVLDEIFEYFAPPIRRIPPLLWIRIRNELGMYLMEKGADGTNCYSWYHRQFWETAEKMFLDQGPREGDPPFRMKAHQAVAEYFEGLHSGGKEYIQKGPSKRRGSSTNMATKMADRQVPTQPIVLAGNRQIGRQLNKRKLSELPYNLLKAQAWDKFESLVARIDFVEAKFEAGQGYVCVSEFIDASKECSSALVNGMRKVIGSGLSYFIRFPQGIYQLASQQSHQSPVYLQYQNDFSSCLPMGLVQDTEPPQTDDPCEMTLIGHTYYCHCQEYSPDGSLIVSTARDASMRIWDVYNGAELVTVTDLPAADYPSDNWATWRERMCCWAPDGKHVLVGSEDGTIQVFDLMGKEMKRTNDHKEALTGMEVSPDKSKLATASKDGTVKFWSTQDWSLLGSATTSDAGWCFGVAFSPDGKRVCTAGKGSKGIFIIDVDTYEVVKQGDGHTTFNLCCAWSPRGVPLVTAGDNSSISCYNESAETTDLLKGHQGWIWCLRFNKDGSRLLACSSDRTLGIFNMDTKSIMHKLGGHLHRVAWVSISPSGDSMVTSSLDQTLKVWDFKAVLDGQVPPVKGLHYSTMNISPNGKYSASSSGWSASCRIEEIHGGGSSRASPSHNGGIENTCWTPDSSRLVTVDMGHTGNYPENAHKNAVVFSVLAADGSSHTKYEVASPFCVCATDKFIVVGTYNTSVHLFDYDQPLEVGSFDWNKEGTSVTTNKHNAANIESIAWSKSSGEIACAFANHVKVWSLSGAPSDISLSCELAPPHDDLVNCVRYSPAGDVMVTGCDTGALTVWKQQQAGGEGYTRARVIRDAVGLFRDLQITADYVASITVEMCLRIYDVQDDCKLKAVYYGPINKFGFTYKGNEICTGEATGNKKLLTF